MKKIIAFTAAFFCTTLCFSGALTPKAEKYLMDFMQFRMDISEFYETPDKCVELIEEWKTNYESDCSGLTEEENLILENFFVLEKYNYVFAKSVNDKQAQKAIHSELKASKDKMDAWFASHKNETPTAWFYTGYADNISCMMSFSISDIMKYAMSVKDFYTKAREVDPQFVLATMNLAQWYFWAPKFAGGGKDKAEKLCADAYSFAKIPSDKYFSAIFYSQYLYESGKKEKSEEVLNVAYEQCPKSLFVKKVKEINKEGVSFLEYNRQTSKLEAPKNYSQN